MVYYRKILKTYKYIQCGVCVCVIRKPPAIPHKISCFLLKVFAFFSRC